MIIQALFFAAALTASAQAIDFDFARTAGDRDHEFGTRQPEGTFDVNTPEAGFVVRQAGYLIASTSGNAWIVLDDPEPDRLNPSGAAGDSRLKSGNSAVIRTRIGYLTSNAPNEGVSAGILFGLSGSEKAASGYLARVQRTPRGEDRLYLDKFVNGARGEALGASAAFSYGNMEQPHTLEVVLRKEPAGAQHYTIKLIFEGDTQAELTGTFSAPVDGWAGLYAEDNSTGNSDNPKPGEIRFLGFQMNTSAAEAK